MSGCLLVERSRESARPDAETADFLPSPCRYWMDGLPPVADAPRLELELRLVPASDREEAIQVAWLAHLDGDDAPRAVKRWWVAALRQRRRERTNEL